MLNNRCLLIVMVCLISLFSCKKDEQDENVPEVEFISPTSKQLFDVGDFITVQLKLKDDVGVQQVSIGLLDQQNRLVQDMYSVLLDPAPEINFTKSYQIYETRLESGTYVLWINVYDGKNQTNAYQLIDINGIPKRLTNVLALTYGSTNLSNIVSYDSVLSSSNVLRSFGGSYASSSISSYEQLLFLSSGSIGETHFIQTKDGATKLSKPFPVGNPQCTQNTHFNQTTYTCFDNGDVIGYNANGTIVFDVDVAGGYHAESIFPFETKYICEQKISTGGVNKLAMYYGTGAGFQETSLQQDMVAVFKMNNNEALVFGNKNDSALMEIYNISGNSYWTPHSMPPVKLLSALQVDSNTYLLATDDNNILKYTYNNNTLIPFKSGVRAEHLNFNEIDQEVYSGAGTTIGVYAYPTGTYLRGAVLTDSLMGMHLLFNR